MEKITSAEQLKARIAQLENRRSLEEAELRKQFKGLHQALKPSRLIVSAIKDISSSGEVRSTVADAAMGMVAGMVTKRFVTGGSGGFLKKILGEVAEIAVAAGVSKNSEAIRSTISDLVAKFFTKKQTGQQEEKSA